MKGKQSYIPFKVIIGYLLLIALVVAAGFIIYSENDVFTSTEDKIELEKNKVLKISTFFSKMYETESQARLTILSNSEQEYQEYLQKTNALKLEIDTLKNLLTTDYQKVLLDSINYLFNKKNENIKQLKSIKNKVLDQVSVKTAIKDITKMEVSLQKLVLKDFVKDPSLLTSYQRGVLVKYVDYLNQNIPNDKTNSLDEKALDSILSKSKEVLKEVKNETTKRNEILNSEEKKLLENEILISEQLRKIIRIVENEISIKTSQNNSEKENSLKKTNKVVTITAIIGLLVTVFFSILILSDFSKSQSYRKQLEIANLKTKNLLQNREQLIATVSHDIKTPLSTILGYSELLSNSELNTKQIYFNKNIKNSSDYISQLVQDLLDLTQIEAGKITLEKTAFNLPNLIDEIAKNGQSVYQKKEINLLIEIDETLNKNIISDAFRLKQILTNIIGNAYKFTENGTIKISANTNLQSKIIAIKIEDTGIGIEESKRELIFEEFTQANENIEKSYGGSGLGLTISKKLTEILSGKISVKSEVNKGSVFEISIPLEFDNSNKNEAKTSTKNHKNYIAIVVDDDSNLLQLTSEILKQNNFTTHSFTSGKDAFEFAKNNTFDILITDIQMPLLDGFELLKSLQENKLLSQNQPIIALTGRTDLSEKEYLNYGFTAILKKPYSPNYLIQIVNSNLNNETFKADFEENNLEGNNSNTSYSLSLLNSFFPKDSFAINEVLLSFIKTTNQNLENLETAILENNTLEIKEIAHKMYPMFKQIQSNEIANLLEDLERNVSVDNDLKSKFETIKKKIKIVFNNLKREIL
ncbi:hybrid sensor histidine kinase/response regulator [Flavobacterium sp.]|uniref:hybrid sensor histidine kinase/response regulator n=1 Tax=Flavobacterium sp. TaxID=239 RepID=UPI0037515BD4